MGIASHYPFDGFRVTPDEPLRWAESTDSKGNVRLVEGTVSADGRSTTFVGLFGGEPDADGFTRYRFFLLPHSAPSPH